MKSALSNEVSLTKPRGRRTTELEWRMPLARLLVFCLLFFWVGPRVVKCFVPENKETIWTKVVSSTHLNVKNPLSASPSTSSVMSLGLTSPITSSSSGWDPPPDAELTGDTLQSLLPCVDFQWGRPGRWLLRLGLVLFCFSELVYFYTCCQIITQVINLPDYDMLV